MATPKYDINYDDERFKDVEAEEEQAKTELNNTYDDMINQSDQFYQEQIDALEEYGKTQQQIQQENTDFAIDKIEQQKEQAEKDYIKEQKGAYADWQKESNKYGVNAEQMASNGLTNTGYSESSQVSMYNTYQNRVATARDGFNRAVLNYDNSIKEAQLANNSALAEIAYNTLQAQLQLSLEGFQYKNQLVLDKISKEQELDNTYYQRWQDVLNQINTENELNESIRRYEKEYKATYGSNKSSGGSGGSSGSSNKSNSYSNTKTNQVNTKYYSGDLNKDAEKYGTFSNGYQPKGISGYGKVSKTGETIQLETQTLDGKKVTVTQNVWKTPDGTLWYWEGRQNKYIKLNTTSRTHGGAGMRM